MSTVEVPSKITLSPSTADKDRSFVPLRAWGETIDDFVPAKEFNHTQFVNAIEYARKHDLAMFSCEISDTSRAMWYIVGCWKSTIEDMALRKELWTQRGPSSIMASSPEALGSVYECITGADQQTLPFFDLEYYADAEHGNESCPDIEAKTHIVSQLGTALMIALFPDQVRTSTEETKCLWREMKEIPTIQRLISSHYKWNDPIDDSSNSSADRGGDDKNFAGHDIPVSIINPVRDWCILDASRDAKRSQHLILSPDVGICWDTLVDQALFVGLLIRCIYEAMISCAPDSTLFGLCQQLFITELAAAPRKASMQGSDESGVVADDKDADIVKEKRKKIWTIFVDDVVYKKKQLIRAPFMTKRTQNRPLLPTRHTDRSKKWHISHTLITRVPRDPKTTQRLSFSRCYPGMFSQTPAVEKLSSSSSSTANCYTPTSFCVLDRWKWVPNYQGRRAETPPTFPHRDRIENTTTNISGYASNGPWTSKSFRQDVTLWLKTVDPCREFPIQGNIVVGGGGSIPRAIQQSIGSTIVYNSSNGEGQTASHCLAKFMARCPELRPWVSRYRDIKALASAMTVKPSLRTNPKTGSKYRTALVCLNDKYCPIQKSEHTSGAPFMLINDKNGEVRVRCLAAKCKSSNYLLSLVLLPEQLALVFPQQRWGSQKTKTNVTISTDTFKSKPTNPEPPKKKRKR